jgi:hypothetical protein
VVYPSPAGYHICGLSAPLGIPHEWFIRPRRDTTFVVYPSPAGYHIYDPIGFGIGLLRITTFAVSSVPSGIPHLWYINSVRDSTFVFLSRPDTFFVVYPPPVGHHICRFNGFCIGPLWRNTFVIQSRLRYAMKECNVC